MSDSHPLALQLRISSLEERIQELVAERDALSKDLDAAHLAGAAIAAELQTANDDRARLRQDLDMATGPHCSCCGNPIDPDCCWCGSDHGPRHNFPGDGHDFIPMGCDCGRYERDWKKLALSWRELLHVERAGHDQRIASACAAVAAHGAREIERHVTCPLLDQFVDGELPADQVASFREHLGGCLRCQRVLRGRMQEAVTADTRTT